ncbi:helix-turn-helix transcriptional regulator [Nocardiopsis sp. NPDC055879]
MPHHGNRKLLTPAEFCEMTGVAPQTASNWRYKGVGPSFIKLGTGRTSRVRYRVADVEAWLDAHQGGAAA